MDADSAIERAIRLAGGSEAKLGDAIGYSQVAVNKARRKGRFSPEMALAIDAFSNGAIPKSEMRPDLWPPQQAKGAA
jgi:DNA-binding transcriptional regulator YdaS (Cro superfamily)